MNSIVALWDSHWSQYHLSSTGLLATRFTREAFATLLTFIDDRDKQVLEVGCGTGRFSVLLAANSRDRVVIGSDMSKNGVLTGQHLRNALGLTNLSFVRSDAFRLPYSNERFDVVFSEGVVQLFPQCGDLSRQSLIREMSRVLKPNGKLIIAVVNWHCYPHTLYKWLRGDRYEYGYEKSFTRHELESFLTQHGLRNATSSAFYPAHSFNRLAEHSRLFHLLGRWVDRTVPSWLANIVGFEVMTKATKAADTDR